MIRNLKALGLALVAMLAMSAVAASSASAWFATGADLTYVTLEATEEQEFSSEGLSISCQEIGIEETTLGTEQESFEATPVYSECAISAPELGTFNAFVSFNGCTYVFTTDTEMHIFCTEGKEIEVKGEFVPPFKSKCIDIPAQTPTNPEVHYKNQGSGSTAHIEIESTVDGVTYTTTGVCGEEKTHHNLDLQGKITVTGENSWGTHVGIAHVA